MSMQDKFSRRAILGRLGGGAAVAALTPFVPYTEVEAAAAARPRYVYWYTPVNPNSSLVNPTLPSSNAEESNLQFRGTYSSLNAMKNKMSLYRGLTNSARKGDLGGGHKDSAVTMLVGTPAKKGNAGSGTVLGDGNAGINGASSIDQWMARELKRQNTTPISDLRFGWENVKDQLRSNSFLDGKEMLRDQNPAAVFRRMFQIAGQSDGGGGGESPLTYRKNILDYVYKDVRKVEGQLSQGDKERLQSHLSAIEDAQRLIDASNNAQACNVPEENNDTFNNRMDLAIQAYIRLTAIAFSCDMTRIAGAQFLPYQAGKSYHNVRDFNLVQLGNKVNATWHSATHGKGGSGADVSAFIRGVQEYRCKIYLDLLQALDNIPEPTGGTLLDSSIVHWYTEVSKDHKAYDLFNLIGGGAGHFRMGKQFVVGGTNENNNYPQNMLLTSIANAMGFPINNFNQYKKGPLPSKFLT